MPALQRLHSILEFFAVTLSGLAGKPRRCKLYQMQQALELVQNLQLLIQIQLGEFFGIVQCAMMQIMQALAQIFAHSFAVQFGHWYSTIAGRAASDGKGRFAACLCHWPWAWL